MDIEAQPPPNPVPLFLPDDDGFDEEEPEELRMTGMQQDEEPPSPEARGSPAPPPVAAKKSRPGLKDTESLEALLNESSSIDFRRTIDAPRIREDANVREQMTRISMASNAAYGSGQGRDAAAQRNINGDDEYGKSTKKGKDEGEKKRKPIPKLNEERLVGADGFPALIKSYKSFKPKGKGHEEEDLRRLMQMYQFWTHGMFPKMQFNDAVERIEKLCHSRRMHIELSKWSDEAHGRTRSRPEDDDDSEQEGDDAARGTAGDATSSRPGSRPTSPSRRISPPRRTQARASSDVDAELDALILGLPKDNGVSSASSDRGTTPSTPGGDDIQMSDGGFTDADLDALDFNSLAVQSAGPSKSAAVEDSFNEDDFVDHDIQMYEDEDVMDPFGEDDLPPVFLGGNMPKDIEETATATAGTPSAARNVTTAAGSDTPASAGHGTTMTERAIPSHSATTAPPRPVAADDEDMYDDDTFANLTDEQLAALDQLGKQ